MLNQDEKKIFKKKRKVLKRKVLQGKKLKPFEVKEIRVLNIRSTVNPIFRAWLWLKYVKRWVLGRV